MIGAQMILRNLWDAAGVWNIEQHDPDAFMEQLNQCGLPWSIIELPVKAGSD